MYVGIFTYVNTIDLTASTYKLIYFNLVSRNGMNILYCNRYVLQINNNRFTVTK